MRRLLGGMLALLLVSGVAGAQTPPVRPPAQTVPTDTPEIAALRVKANAGDADAQYNLGVWYNFGHGVPQDSVQAIAWIRKAADQGLVGAQFNLGNAYRDGQGVPQDYVESHKWFNLAASRMSAANQQQLADARTRLDARDAVAALMTPTQIEAAQQRASAWLAAFKKRGGK